MWNFVSIRPTGFEIFHNISKNFNLLVEVMYLGEHNKANILLKAKDVIYGGRQKTI